MPYIKPKYFTYVGMTLTLLYAIGAPVYDLNYKISSTIGHSFLDAQHNTTTFENYLYYISYIPLILFALIWAYGKFKQIKNNKNKNANSATMAAIGIMAGSLVLYFILSFYFGFQYHFVF